MEGASGDDERFEASLLRLLEATESLWTALADSAPAEVWEERIAGREAAYLAVERAASTPEGGRRAVGAVARACLERIAELDGAMLGAGREELARMQRERVALGSRRRAVLAHGQKPREAPRAVTVKA